MKFSLVVCTYMRPQPLLNLLNSVKSQTLYPSEILIIDGSTNNLTKKALDTNLFINLKYYKVDEANRGLTRQRNFGVNLVGENIDIICFLDDDTVLELNYFENLINTYKLYPEALAVGGYIINETNWEKSDDKVSDKNNFYFDGWKRKESSRFKLRGIFGLLPDKEPGFMSTFSHGRPISFLPPSRKTYEVEMIMGGVSSYKKDVFRDLSFSNYFEGYGLYEDADFSLRIAKKGKIYVNTNAQLHHYHDYSGRPNKFAYGKMVVRNGWYVWRVKYPKPNIKSRLKWNATSFLLTIVRFANVITSNNKREALTESFGRFVGWLSLIFNKPSITT